MNGKNLSLRIPMLHHQCLIKRGFQIVINSKFGPLSISVKHYWGLLQNLAAPGAIGGKGHIPPSPSPSLTRDVLWGLPL